METIEYRTVQTWTDDEIREFTQDILTVAAEGGINYWATFNTERADDLTVTALVNVMDAEDENIITEKLSWLDVWETTKKWAKNPEDFNVSGRYWEWFMSDFRTKEACMIDADVADSIIQLAIFGELVYG